MKTTFLIFMSILLVSFSACQQAKEATTELQTTDSLSQLWIDAWNAADVDAITSLFTADAQLVTDTLLIGRETIKAGFVLPAAPIFRNLTCKKLNEQISGDLAYLSGSYAHEWLQKDSSVVQAKGYYSMVWKKQDDKSWKVVQFQTN